MNRLRFQKVGDGVFLSHLDVMRVFQRSFRRAGILLKHSQGYSPRPYVSVALPMSVGTESLCELLDFELEDGALLPENLCGKLNETMPSGIVVTEAYTSDSKVKNLAFLSSDVVLEYDNGIPENAAHEIERLLTGDRLIVAKRSKGELVDTDIAPMIREVCVHADDKRELTVSAVVCAQNPSLNPALLAEAVQRYLPQYAPDFYRIRRKEVFTADGTMFR